jgi:D-3-phosphoglycerate dehydrogenase
MAIIANNSRPKILIPEKVSADGLALLKDKFEVHEKKGLSPDELKGIIGEYEALIVRSETQVTAELLDAAKRLKVVARAGVGVDNVDVQSATTHGIIVVNSPSGNINAAAEHTIACAYHTTITTVTDHHSAHGCGTQHRRCITKYQGWQMGTQSTRWV